MEPLNLIIVKTQILGENNFLPPTFLNLKIFQKFFKILKIHIFLSGIAFLDFL
jgi:hypothetical protein